MRPSVSGVRPTGDTLEGERPNGVTLEGVRPSVSEVVRPTSDSPEGLVIMGASLRSESACSMAGTPNINTGLGRFSIGFVIDVQGGIVMAVVVH